MSFIRGVIPAILATAAAFGQAADAKPEFEVASIKPSGPFTGDRVNLGVHIDGAQLTGSFFSLKDYLGMAYRLRDYQITGPDWLASERFNIAAKLPAGVPRDKVPEMLQALLAERFEMKTHRDSKEFPVYALIVGKSGPKLKASEPGDGTETGAVNVDVSGGRAGTTVNLGKGSYFSMGNNRFEAKKVTMTGLADMLARFLDRPVVDMTKLPGSYDFALDITPEDFRAMMIRSAITAGVNLPPEAMRALDGASDASLYTALDIQGLKLEKRKAPLDVLVVDHAVKTPTDN